jgi:Subtilase family
MAMLMRSAAWTDQWFDDLERCVLPIVNKDRKDRQRPIRVAVLDTGIDAAHPTFQKAILQNKIRATRGFPETLEPLIDRHGHGTHGGSVLMRIAPNAVLYFARIADDQGHISPDNEYEEITKV